MAGATLYDAYIEVQPDGSHLAQLLDLLGCFGQGSDQAGALAELQARVQDYYAWLRRHDDYTPDVRGPFVVAPKQVERVQVVNGRAIGAFFEREDEPVTGEDLDWALALLDWAYSDLYAHLSALPPDALEHLDPEGRSLRATVEHLAQEQLWLISRIDPASGVPHVGQLPGTPLDKLRQVWQASLHRLRHTSDDERERILDADGERWSLRKVLRRSVLSVRMRHAMLGG